MKKRYPSILYRVSLILLAIANIFILYGSITLSAEQPSLDGSHPGQVLKAPSPWWQNAIIYEIYPRSFQDTDGDGIGDLKGIIRRLDYLQSLGVDAIWLTPVYPSPQVDFGYDISNYEAIDPQYGSMADFDDLLTAANKHNIRIIMDLVMNHTSDQHPWFTESASSTTNPKRNWYVWRDGKAPGVPPNNWQSLFGHSSWKYSSITNQWYYHKFYPEQPDLNWRNPEVRNAMFTMIRFWLDKGVAGFRLDAIPSLYEDAEFHDEKILPGTNAFGDPKQDTTMTDNLPEVHDVLRDLRKIVESYPGSRVLVGETYMSNTEELAKMYGVRHDELQLPMDTQVGFINKLDVTTFRTKIEEAQTKIDGNQPLFVIDNHDNIRSWNRYGDGAHNDAIAHVLAAVLLTTRSTALMYYGQELGMVATPPTLKDDVKDPIGITGWPTEKGRDGERTPMQWDGTKYGGFSTATPWLPVPSDVAMVNVGTEEQRADSILNWYKQLITLRRTNAAVGHGANIMLNHDKENTLVWLRRYGAETVVVLENLDKNQKTISIGNDLKLYGIADRELRILLTSGDHSATDIKPSAIKLPGFGVIIAGVK